MELGDFGLLFRVVGAMTSKKSGNPENIVAFHRCHFSVSISVLVLNFIIFVLMVLRKKCHETRSTSRLSAMRWELECSCHSSFSAQSGVDGLVSGSIFVAHCDIMSMASLTVPSSRVRSDNTVMPMTHLRETRAGFQRELQQNLR